MISAARDKAASGPSGAADGSSASSKPHRKRVRNFTADDRAAHRIFERNRRESFRERLNDLAKELPALAGKNPQRLSKHTVLDESIARHRFMQSNCLHAIQSMRDLIQERDELLTEINTWRNASGLNERQPRAVDMNAERLGSLEKAIHMNPSDSSSGCTSQSPDSELGPKNVEDGNQTGFASQPHCSSLTTFMAAAQGAHDDMSNPFPLSTG
ncbi:hypothetical protein B0J13DRAFT_612216 [Dactylonectria estremocensis]|uniref:BHLH domain-containing protein n=1 Tax=Dactylonectria estremocensis TaxID=1079267 RepID=A0A9P9DPU8_9HYPO|nr:hypothetical protein B0J13DRAFT_612216 [Dactylonectria estremocensis]